MSRAAFAGVVVLMLGACAPDERPADAAAALLPFRVEDGHIRDDDDRVVILRGVNLSGYHKNAPYFDFHQPPDYRAVHDELGMNAVRFLISWAAVEPQPDAFDDAYLADVRARLDWAREAGLLVVLDMHQDLYGEGFPGGNGAPRWTCDEARYAAYRPQEEWYLGYLDENVSACFDRLWGDVALQDHYARAWAHVAALLGDHPAVIGFEVMNEPWQGTMPFDTFEALALQPFYERVIPAVRAEAPHWLAFVEPMSMSNLGRDTHLTTMPFDGVVYAPHSYNAASERARAFDEAARPLILSKLVGLAAEARAMGAALWIGEFGGDADFAGITAYMDAEQDAVASVFAGSAYWDYSRGEGFGILNDDGTEKTALWDVLVRPAPERVAGDPLLWSYDDASRVLTVSWIARGAASSIMRAPARTYPSGFVVDVQGGNARVDGSHVTIDAQDGDTVTLTIRPVDSGGEPAP